MSARLPAICLIAISVIWALTFLAFPAGLFTIDEMIQVAGIDGFVRTGGFTVENDGLATGHQALHLWFLRPGASGLVPQYPSGFTILAAPFWMLGGVKGVMALNLVAAFCVAALAGLIARDAVGTSRAGMAAAALTMGATFLPDYAFAFWPHAVAVAISTFAVWAALRAVTTVDWRWPLAVGLALGFGGLIRVDVWFMVPALAMWAVLASERPIRDLFLAGVGLAPGVLAASTLNWIKFAHFFPASYGLPTGGGGSGAVSAGGYNFAFFMLAIAALACVTARLTRPRWGWIAGVIGIAGLALLEGGAGYFSASLRGIWVLGVDLRDFIGVDVDRFIYSTPEGGVVFYFTLKKALAQSMPWLGVLPTLWLATRNGRESERRFASLLAIMAPTLMVFFASREWHGGLSSNLRYLLALTPLFAVGAIIAVSRLPGRAMWGWGAGVLVALILPVLFLTTTQPTTFRVNVEQHLPPILFAVLVAATCLAAVAPVHLRGAFGAMARAGAGAAITLALFTVFIGDVLTNFNRRAIGVQRAAIVAETPPQSLVYSGGFAGSWPVFEKPDVNLVAADRLTGEIAHDLVSVVLEQGWRVFADDPEATAAVLAAYPKLIAEVLAKEPYRAEIKR